LQKITPTIAQNSTISTKRQATHDYLLEGFDNSSNIPLLRTVVIGSAARGTMIRPIEDIDVMAVFSDQNNAYENTYYADSHAFMQRIRSVLGNESTVTVGTRGQAVRLFYKDGIHVDVAPVFSDLSGGYLLPTGDGSWMKTNPDAQAVWFTNEASRLSDHLRPVVRLLKRWNKVHSSHFKSYHLEVVIANTFGSMKGNYRNTLANFFEWAPSFIDAYDPAGYSGNLANYLTTTERTDLINRLNNASLRAKAALSAEGQGDHREAIRLWGIELGHEFPTYG